MGGALDGLRVIEMAGLGPAPLAGQLLADQGADVVVIDRKSAPLDPSDINRRGKRSIALNLKTEGGIAAVMALIGKADVLIEGFRPGVMEKLGLGPDDMAALNAGLIYARMTGWGQDGPLAKTAGHDINYLALTGTLYMIGPKETPIPPLNLAADYGGGTMFLLFGILSALFERQRSGKGQVVDAAMMEGAPAMLGLVHQWIAKGDWRMERASNLIDGGAPFYRCYATRDGRHMAVGALEPQFFAALVDGLGVGIDLGRQMDRSYWPEMEAIFAARFAGRSMADWTDVFEGSDACVSPVLMPEEAASHPHVVARGALTNLDGVLQAAPAPRLSRSGQRAPIAPGAPGAEAEEILSEAGYDAAGIAALKQAGGLT